MLFGALGDLGSSVSGLPSPAHTALLPSQPHTSSNPRVLKSTTLAGAHHISAGPLCRCFKSVTRSTALREPFNPGLTGKILKQKNPSKFHTSLDSRQIANKGSL